MLGNGRVRSGREDRRFLSTQTRNRGAADARNDAPDDWEPVAVHEDCWDVFILDDENAEPEPERGDFWGELNDSEPV